MKKYTVVEFQDGLQLVPSKWLNADATSCLWPDYIKNQYQLNKAVIDSITPDNGKSWIDVYVRRIFTTAETYEKGIEKLCVAQETSNVESTASDGDAEGTKERKRRRVKARKLIDDSSDEEPHGTAPPSKLPAFPPIPQFSKDETVKRTTDGNYNIIMNKYNYNDCSSRNNTISKPSDKTSNYKSNVVIREDITIPGPSRWNSPDVSHASGSNYNVGDVDVNKATVYAEKVQIPNQNISQSSRASNKIANNETEVVTNDFKKMVLAKLNKILYVLNSLEERITKLENSNHQNTDRNKIFDLEDDEDLGLPVMNITGLTNFEAKLKDPAFFSKMVISLKTLGGSDVNTACSGILKRLVCNSLAEKYSWAGFKGKLPFKELRLVRIVKKTVRIHLPDVTDETFAEVISKWLAQSKLRKTREEERNRKKNLSNAEQNSQNEEEN